MNITYNPKRGSLLLVMLLCLVVLVIGGVVVYIIMSFAGAPPRDPSQEAEDMTFLITTDPEVVGEYFPDFTPPVGAFNQSSAYTATMERSTNLVDWEDLYVIPDGQSMEVNDTNPPWPQAFYRVRFDTP